MFSGTKVQTIYYWFVGLLGLVFLGIGIYMGVFTKNLPNAVILFLTVLSFVLAFLELLSLVIKKIWLSVTIAVLGLVLGFFMFSKVSLDSISDNIVDITVNAFAIVALGATLVTIAAKRLESINALKMSAKEN